jgi:hypothetical protein
MPLLECVTKHMQHHGLFRFAACAGVAYPAAALSRLLLWRAIALVASLRSWRHLIAQMFQLVACCDRREYLCLAMSRGLLPSSLLCPRQGDGCEAGNVSCHGFVLHCCSCAAAGTAADQITEAMIAG